MDESGEKTDKSAKGKLGMSPGQSTSWKGFI